MVKTKMWEQSWQSWKVQVSYNKGGEWDWRPNPHFQWFIFRIPGWHCIAGVLLSAEGVILSAEGVLLSGHIEFPGHITLQVSFCLVTCPGHCDYSSVSWRCPLAWTPKFPGLLSIITWMDTWLSWNFPRLLEEVDLLCTWFCNIMYYLHYHVLKYL